MKFLIGFFIVTYIFMIFYPKFTVTINGVRSNSLSMRLKGAIIVAILLTLCVGLPLLGILSMFT